MFTMKMKFQRKLKLQKETNGNFRFENEISEIMQWFHGVMVSTMNSEIE